MNKDRFTILLDGWRRQSLTQAEIHEFLSLVKEPAYAGILSDVMDKDFADPGIIGRSTPENIQAAREEFEILTAVPRDGGIPVVRRMWPRYAAAAIIVLFGVGMFFWLNRRETGISVVSTRTGARNIAPGGMKAFLRLSDGREITLDSAANGYLAQQQGADIVKSDGQIIYNINSTPVINVVHNTLVTPRGGQYQVKLPDGTRVWLNAASSITYPTAFTGDTREVKISGEVYFEVAKNAKQPFVVKTSGEDITVLGTHFNVRAYEDEPANKTTLLEGVVRVGAQVLKPGYAYLNGSVIRANVEQDLAWKNGYFNFEDKTLKEVMRELSRWYDLKVVYEQGIGDMRFVGEMPRNLTLLEVLKAIEGAGIQFRLEDGNVLSVTP